MIGLRIDRRTSLWGVEDLSNVASIHYNPSHGYCTLFSKFYEDREYKKFIKNVERQVRSSREYHMYVELLRTNISALNLDNILSHITTEDADLEFHHYPFSLYDMVDVMAIQKFFDAEDFTSLSLAKEVMELHYENLVGLVPLSKTTHELAHSGHLFLSASQVFGDYKKFMEKYPSGISETLQAKIEEMEDFTADNHPSDVKGLF